MLLYVYPLKWVFTLFVAAVFGLETSLQIKPSEIPLLFVVYGLGFATVFFVFALLHLRAYRKREALELDACEQFMTRAAIWHHLALGSIGLLNVCLALILPMRYAGMAGWAYLLIAVVETVYGSIESDQQRKILAQTLQTAPEATPEHSG